MVPSSQAFFQNLAIYMGQGGAKLVLPLHFSAPLWPQVGDGPLRSER